jgi:two-component system phosphate regulon sensor histidine kinase PhoR
MIERKERSWPIPLMAIFFTVSLFATIFFDNQSQLEFKLSWLALIPTASITVNIYLLFTLAKRKSQIKSILWFSVFLISVVFWAITDLMAFSAANAYTGVFARSFVIIPALIGAPAFYIFIKDNTSEKTERYIGQRILLLFNSYFYLVIALATNYILIRDPQNLINRFWGYELKLGLAGSFYIVLAQIVMFMSAFTLYKYYRSRKQSQQIKQARIFLISILIPAVGITVTNLIPALFELLWIPIDSLYMTIMAALMVYGINKYQLFLINPTQISNNILETMAESVIVTSNEFELQYANNNAGRILNVKTPLDSYEEYLENFMDGENFARVQDFAKKNEIIKKPKKFTDVNIISKKIGEETPVEISMSSILTDNGKNAGYVFVLSDLSELQKAYTKLAEQEKKVERKVIERTEELFSEHAKLEASIAGLPIGFIMLDEHMKIIEQNKVAQQLFSTRDNSRWYVEDALEEMGVEREVLRKSQHGEIIDIPEVAKGSKFLHIIISPIVRDEKRLGSVILIEDVTNQRVVERERNEFIVTASHEIRTPLSIIQGNLSNALDMPKEHSRVTGNLIGKAYDASNHISSLFNDILIVSDIENSTNPKPKFETEFELADALKEVVEKVLPKAQEKKLPIKLSEVSGIKVKADRDEIKEALLKLIDNAVKFTAKGSVNIKLSKKGSDVLIKVIDSGKGISESEEKRLFRKFVRLDNSLKRDSGGTGLGLYIAKALAERNSGSLELESSSKNGSTFCLKLPAVK